MVLLYFLLFLVLLYCVVTTNYENNNSIRPTTTVQAEISTMPQVHRRVLLPSIVPSSPPPSPIESSPSPRDDGWISSSVGEHFQDTNTTVQHDIAYLVPMIPAPMKHHRHHHRRARNIRGTLYWGAVYTILFGGVIALMTILIYVLTLCPACCYPTSGCDSGDNNSSKQNDCTKKPSIVKHSYRNGWWRNYFSYFLSSSDRTSSTDTMSTADDSVSIREEDIIISTGSCQSIPNNDTTTMYDDVASNGNNEKEQKDHPSHLVAAVVDGPTCMTEEAMVDDGFYHIKYLPEDDVDHTIMVDVYRHYVYKGDNDVDTSSFDFY